VAAARLSGGARRHGKVPLALLTVLLDEGTAVEQVLVGQFHGLDAAAALVGDEVILVNGREWEPEVVRIPVGPGLQVQGLQDGRTASLSFLTAGEQHALERVADTALAVEFANRVRQRLA
jgi:hypothetical protein